MHLDVYKKVFNILIKGKETVLHFCALFLDNWVGFIVTYKKGKDMTINHIEWNGNLVMFYLENSKGGKHG